MKIKSLFLLLLLVLASTAAEARIDRPLQQQLYVPIHAAANSQLTWTDMPAAETMLSGGTTRIQKIDMTGYTQAKLVCRVGTGGATGAKLIVRYNAAGSVSGTIAGNWTADLGVTEIACPFSTGTGMIDSGWINIAAAAKGDYHLAIIGSTGDGAADPAFGGIWIMFR